VVLIAIGTFVLGLVGGWLAARRARVAAPVTDPAASAETRVAGEPAAEAEVVAHRLVTADASAAGAAPGEPTAPPGSDMTATARLERDERARYAEIIGIETENASLRAVAARVPGLERRVRELEAALEPQAGHDEPVIDLTGHDSVVRPDGADI
jgi:hypothetical protein